jgi:hypothetical protein
MLVTSVLLLAGCIREQQPISFRQDVQPILQANCIECHVEPDGAGYLKTGLVLTSHAGLMRGNFYGPVIIPGDSRHSVLNMLVEGRVDPSIRMPHGREALGSYEIEVLRLWVDYGALNN